MLRSIAQDIRQQFDYGNKITQLIIINVGIYIVVNLISIGITLFSGFDRVARKALFDEVIRNISLSGDLMFTVTHPWVLVTHMFVHVSFWHVLFNMLFLFWFGRIVGDMIGDRRIVPLYLMAGWFGALIFLLSAPLIGAHGVPAYGASASVMGFVLAAGILAPEYRMRLLLIGDVRLKYIVLAVILLDLFGLGSMENTGGHLAHLGGAAFGAIFIALLRRGRDLAEPLNQLGDFLLRFFSRRKSSIPRRRSAKATVFMRHKASARSVRVEAERPSPRDEQERLDAILDKIKEKGYDNLTPEEKEFLFQASKK